MEFVSPFDQQAIRRVFVDAFRVRDILFPVSEAEAARWEEAHAGIPSISSEAEMLKVIHLLHEHPLIRVEALSSTVGYVDGRSLNQLTARMWLFGLVGLVERHFEVAIDLCYPGGAWQPLLSPSRIEAAVQLQAEKLRQGPSADLLGCLQISDKIAILLADPHMATDLGYTSRRHMKHAMKALATLRNHLAHHQEIFPHCQEAAIGMAQQLDSILCGTRLQKALQGIGQRS